MVCSIKIIKLNKPVRIVRPALQKERCTRKQTAMTDAWRMLSGHMVTPSVGGCRLYSSEVLYRVRAARSTEVCTSYPDLLNS